jgi:hypothetical protein
MTSTVIGKYFLKEVKPFQNAIHCLSLREGKLPNWKFFFYTGITVRDLMAQIRFYKEVMRNKN